MALPSLDGFQEIVDDYYKGLSEKRRDKALITPKTYSDIVKAILNPQDTKFKDPQFRYWSRTNFVFEHEIFAIPIPSKKEDFVLYRKDARHGFKKVILTKHMYEIICQAHYESGHRSRDRTMSYIKKNGQTNIPKKLVDAFIKKCPYCNATNHNKKRPVPPLYDFLQSSPPASIEVHPMTPPEQEPRQPNPVVPQQLPHEQPLIQNTTSHYCQQQHQPSVVPYPHEQYFQQSAPACQQNYEPPPFDCISPHLLSINPEQSLPF